MLFAVTVAASERTYARVVAPTSLPRAASARPGGSSHFAVARHTTRFPSLLAGIRRKPSPPLTWPDDALATGGGQCRTGANETELSQGPAGIRLADTRHTMADGHPEEGGPPVSIEAISPALNLGAGTA
jgi:hypothetical protein